MAEDEAFPLTRAEAVERVRPLLADPPTTTSARSSFVLPLVDRAAAPRPGSRAGRIATSPEAAQTAAADGPPGHPRPRRDLARRRPRHGGAAGILTSRGGLASHAAVVARGWGIPAVVGATGIDGARTDRVVDRRPDPRARRRHHDRRAHRRGLRGRHPGHDRGRARGPDAPRLGGGARYGRGIGAGDGGGVRARSRSDRGPAAGASAAQTRKITPDACLRVIAIKGFALPQGVADAVLADPAASSRSSTSSRSTGSSRPRPARSS